ncbi:hypothetical protein PR048_011910 [Dryococelus australis]|uniref:Uncharacterized protein n=1 Tax=Dryococelus australis TaxID=614101 RepID=A0ABQ9HN92_9NEOP|nr:hypothetical protein PR048_011910 [Dryococelus australis]
MQFRRRVGGTLKVEVKQLPVEHCTCLYNRYRNDDRHARVPVSDHVLTNTRARALTFARDRKKTWGQPLFLAPQLRLHRRNSTTPHRRHYESRLALKVQRCLCAMQHRLDIAYNARGSFLTRMWESCRTMPMIAGFPRGPPVSHAPLIPALLQTHLNTQQPLSQHFLHPISVRAQHAQRTINYHNQLELQFTALIEQTHTRQMILGSNRSRSTPWNEQEFRIPARCSMTQATRWPAYCSIFTSITLIGSQDLAVKSRPNLFTSYFKYINSSLAVSLVTAAKTKRSNAKSSVISNTIRVVFDNRADRKAVECWDTCAPGARTLPQPPPTLWKDRHSRSCQRRLHNRPSGNSVATGLVTLRGRLCGSDLVRGSQTPLPASSCMSEGIRAALRPCLNSKVCSLSLATLTQVRLENNMAARDGAKVSTECTSSFTLSLSRSLLGVGTEGRTPCDVKSERKSTLSANWDTVLTADGVVTNAGMKRWGKRVHPEKTHRPEASPATIPTSGSDPAGNGTQFAQMGGGSGVGWRVRAPVPPTWQMLSSIVALGIRHQVGPARALSTSIMSQQRQMKKAMALACSDPAVDLPQGHAFSAYWSLSCVSIGCCRTPGSYGICKVFHFKSTIGSEGRREGLINCDPIAKVTSLTMGLEHGTRRAVIVHLTRALYVVLPLRSRRLRTGPGRCELESRDLAQGLPHVLEIPVSQVSQLSIFPSLQSSKYSEQRTPLSPCCPSSAQRIARVICLDPHKRVPRLRTRKREISAVERFLKCLGHRFTAEVSNAAEGELRRRMSGDGMQERVKQESREETSWLTATSDMFPACEDPGDTAENRNRLALVDSKYGPFSITSHLSEALIKFYFQDIPPPRANLVPAYLELFPASKAEKRARDKDDTATRIKRSIAAKRKALNWRAKTEEEPAEEPLQVLLPEHARKQVWKFRITCHMPIVTTQSRSEKTTSTAVNLSGWARRWVKVLSFCALHRQLQTRTDAAPAAGITTDTRDTLRALSIVPFLPQLLFATIFSYPCHNRYPSADNRLNVSLNRCDHITDYSLFTVSSPFMDQTFEKSPHWRVVNCCKVSWRLLTDVHYRCLQQGRFEAECKSRKIVYILDDNMPAGVLTANMAERQFHDVLATKMATASVCSMITQCGWT